MNILTAIRDGIIWEIERDCWAVRDPITYEQHHFATAELALWWLNHRED